jgi:hypothetical protein
MSKVAVLMKSQATLGPVALNIEREKEIADLVAKTTGQKKGSIHQQIVGLRKFVPQSVGDTRVLLAGKHANPAIIRQELARHIDSITVLPEGEGKEIRYKGEWKLLGDISGAEGGNCTTRPPSFD